MLDEMSEGDPKRRMERIADGGGKPKLTCGGARRNVE